MGNMGSGGCCGNDKNKTPNANKTNTGACTSTTTTAAPKAGQMGAPQTPNANKK